MNIIIPIIIALLICGFLFWAVRKIVALIPMDPLIHQVIDVLLIIAVVAIILFYVIIPLLNMLGGIHIPIPHL